MVTIYYGSRQNIDRENLQSKEIVLGSAVEDRVQFIFLTSARMCCATIDDDTVLFLFSNNFSRERSGEPFSYV